MSISVTDPSGTGKFILSVASASKLYTYISQDYSEMKSIKVNISCRLGAGMALSAR